MKKLFLSYLLFLIPYFLFAQNIGIGTITPQSRLEITHNGASTYGTALLLNQNVIGNSDGPRIQFYKTMTSSKSWTAGMLNGVNIGSFSINEDGGTDGFGNPRLVIAPGGDIGIGTSNPNAPLSFANIYGKKITLYSGTIGNAGFSIDENRLMIHSDNPNADVAIGYDSAGTFKERLAIKPNGTIAINGAAGQPGDIITNNAAGIPEWKPGPRVYNDHSDYYMWQPNTGTSLVLPGFSLTIPLTRSSSVTISVLVKCNVSNVCTGCPIQIRGFILKRNGSEVARIETYDQGFQQDLALPAFYEYLSPGTYTYTVEVFRVAQSQTYIYHTASYMTLVEFPD